MEQEKTEQKMSRRDFLKLIGVAGVAVAGGAVISEFAPWLDYQQAVDDTWQSKSVLPTAASPLRALVHYATLAANGHNTQPWRFIVRDQEIQIHPDLDRALPVVDPQHRELWISLGCALENLLLAASAAGYATEVAYPEAAGWIGVRLSSDTPQPSPLFDAIPLRQNTRSEYDGQTVSSAQLDELRALPLEAGVELRFFTDTGERQTLLDYVNQGNLVQYADRAFVDELIDWLRFTKREALASMDGLYTRCSGNPELPRWLGQMFVAGTNPQDQADADTAKLRSSAGAVLIATAVEDPASWVRAGQVYERLALKMTSLGIQSAFLNQPIEVAALRGQFQSALGLGASLPQLLVRFGHADSLPRSLRRPVDAVLTTT